MKGYTIIRTEEQYWKYCNDLEKLTNEYRENPSDELIETVSLLIEKYDEAHATLEELDPIQLLKSLMEDNHMKQRDLAQLLAISKGHVSDILNYKKGLSKNVIRLLSDRFKVRQDAFNRTYELFQVTNKQNGNAEQGQLYTQK